MTKVFIDGAAGTTGLRIHERLAERNDLSLIILPEELRKDDNARKQALNEADIVFLCLPDAAAVQAVSLIENEGTAVIDTSTAHRTDPAWVYGFPEIIGRDRVKTAKRIANPGCHASGFIALAAPLVKAGIIPENAALSCFSLTGYSGGGKSMIAQYEAPERDPLLGAPRQYGISQMHKHLPEMAKIAGLSTDPLFAPIVADFYSGMEVTVPVFSSQINGTKEDIIGCYKEFYGESNGPVVNYKDNADEGGFLSASALAGKDGMEISVAGNSERIILTARFDNLGKGASGAAIQNMNLLLGSSETEGLIL